MIILQKQQKQLVSNVFIKWNGLTCSLQLTLIHCVAEIQGPWTQLSLQRMRVHASLSAAPFPPYRRYFASLNQWAKQLWCVAAYLIWIPWVWREARPQGCHMLQKCTPTVDLQANPWQQVDLRWSLLSRTQLLQNQLGSREQGLLNLPH